MLEYAFVFFIPAIMFVHALKSLYHVFKTNYQRLNHYFTSGAFGVAFYPFLLHPCVRHSYHWIVRAFAVLSVFCALYAFFAEFIAVLFSENSFASAYTQHTPIELLIKPNTIVELPQLSTSPLFYSVQVIYLLQGGLFFGIFLFCITRLSQNHHILLTGICALLFGLGCLLVTDSQGGKWTVGGLRNTGFAITFIIVHILVFLTGIFSIQGLPKFKWYSIIAGFIGIGALTFPFFMESEFTPLLERLALYLFFIWEIALGFCTLDTTYRQSIED